MEVSIQLSLFKPQKFLVPSTAPKMARETVLGLEGCNRALSGPTIQLGPVREWNTNGW